jgi:ATP-dependent helicase/nuclease subunit B
VHSRTLAALLRITGASPTQRKRLVTHDLSYGRELLASTARAGGGWIGWEPATLRSIADALAFVALHQAGRRVGSDLEIDAVVESALDAAVRNTVDRAVLGDLTITPGVRVAVRDAVLSLRMAGVDAAELRRVTIAGRPGAILAPVLAAYETQLVNAGLADAATIFHTALDAFDAEAPYVLDGATWYVGMHHVRGLPGALLRKLVAFGAQPLDTDLMATLDAGSTRHSLLAFAGGDAAVTPDETTCDRTLVTVDLFTALTPDDELREIARRVLAAGVRWDEVEVVTADPDAYGIAISALARTLDIRVSLSRGVPFFATRLGRVFARWFAWLESDLDAQLLRDALEAGDFRSPDAAVTAAQIGRALRAHRVAWGRVRYEALLQTLRETSIETLSAPVRGLLTFLTDLLAITPEVPTRERANTGAATVASVAQTALALLERVAVRVEEGPAVERLTLHLSTLADSVAPPTAFLHALAFVRTSLTELRAWPDDTAPPHRPQRAQGGAMHLTDFASAGATNRRHTFVVGCDVARLSAGTTQDAFLPDAVLRRIGPARVADGVTRRMEKHEEVVRGLAQLRGHVTFSYAVHHADGSLNAPAPLLLHVRRLQQQNPALSFDDLRMAMQPPVGAVPLLHHADHGVVHCDARDVWLATVSPIDPRVDSLPLVRAAWPALARGLDVAEGAAGDVANGAHGLVPDAGHALPPTVSGAPVSASSLEEFAICGLRWFYRRGLGLSTPVDAPAEDEGWLDAAQRGTLLHAVFARFVAEYIGRQHEIVHEEAAETLRAIVERELAALRDVVPPPDSVAYDVAAAATHRAAAAFLVMERNALQRGDAAGWHAVERRFGRGEGVSYRLTDDRVIRLRGTADRVDEYADGALRIIDYKTGGTRKYEADATLGPLNGGRLLQPALYGAGIHAETGCDVRTFEYRFPTERGANGIIVRHDSDATVAPAVVTSLVQDMEAGHFLPTTLPADCGFCEYAAICRASSSRWAVDSPRATWAAEHVVTLPELAGVRARSQSGTV